MQNLVIFIEEKCWNNYVDKARSILCLRLDKKEAENFAKKMVEHASRGEGKCWIQREDPQPCPGTVQGSEEQDNPLKVVVYMPLTSIRTFKYVCRVTYMDSTHGMTGHPYLLLNLVGTDPMGHSVTIAAGLIPSESAATVTTFLLKVKEWVGDDFDHVQTMFTDLALGFAKPLSEHWAFSRIKHVYCIWHANRAWSGRLSGISAVFISAR